MVKRGSAAHREGRASGRRCVVIASVALLFAASLGPLAARADGGAEAAAREAAARYDARVLDVKTEADQYRVKLLLPSGKVKIVRVPRDDGARDRGGDRGQTNGQRAGRRSDAFGRSR